MPGSPGTEILQPQKTLSMVVPFYNESEGIHFFFEHIVPLLNSLTHLSWEIVCVDDGSSDDTLSQLVSVASRNSRVRVIELSRNFGKEAALTAGIEQATGDAVIPIDADLQDPPELIPRMVAEWEKGAEVVLARRADRSSDSFLKRLTAEGFYRIHNTLSKPKLPQNVGDFRLMDRAVVEALKMLPENQRFMKGLFAWAGFRTVSIDYTRQIRAAGETKFSGWKLWNLALEGITSFSSTPLRIWTYVGIVIAFLTFLYGFFIALRTLFLGVDVPGYASLLVAVLFLGSLQLISIGLLGEYIGRVYQESKRRPVYIIRKIYHSKHEQ